MSYKFDNMKQYIVDTFNHNVQTTRRNKVFSTDVLKKVPVLYGDEGIGKTSCVKEFCEENGFKLITVGGKALTKNIMLIQINNATEHINKSEKSGLVLLINDFNFLNDEVKKVLEQYVNNAIDDTFETYHSDDNGKIINKKTKQIIKIDTIPEKFLIIGEQSTIDKEMVFIKTNEDLNTKQDQLKKLLFQEEQGLLEFDDYQSGYDRLENFDKNIHTKLRLPILSKMAQFARNSTELCDIAYNMANESFHYAEGIEKALELYSKASLAPGGISTTLSTMLRLSNLFGHENIVKIVESAVEKSTDTQDLWDCIDIGKELNDEVPRQCLKKCLYLCTSEQDFYDSMHDDFKTILTVDDRLEIGTFVREKFNNTKMVESIFDYKEHFRFHFGEEIDKV